MRNYWSFWISLFLVPSVFAATHIEVVNNGQSKIHVSKQGYNRLGVDNDRILSVNGEQGTYDLQPDEKTGEVYLKPIRGSHPFDLFITTESLAHYQLTVLPSEENAQSILLKPIDKERAMLTAKKITEPYINQISHLMKIMAAHVHTKDYRLITSKDSSHRLDKRLWYKRLNFYEGAHLDGEMLKVTNGSKESLNLAPSQFYQPGVAAVAIEESTLIPHAQTMVYRVWDHE